MAIARNDEADRRLNLTVGLVIVLGCAAVVAAAWVGSVNGELTHPSSFRVLIVFAMLTLASCFVLHVRIKASNHDTVMSDAAMLIGFMLVPGSWLVLCTALAVIAAKIGLRVAPVKAAFNAAKATVVAGSAVAVGWMFGLAGPFNASAGRLLGLTVVAFVLLVSDELVVIPVIALATRTPVRELFRTNWDVRWGSTAIRLALAIVAMFGISRQPILDAPKGQRGRSSLKRRTSLTRSTSTMFSARR